MSYIVNDYGNYSGNPIIVHGKWRALQIFSTYRVFFAITLLTLYWFNVSYISSSDHALELSLFLTFFYCVFSFVVASVNYKASLPLEIVAYGQYFVDLFILTLLINNNHAMLIPLGVLININIAAISLLNTSRVTYFFSSCVTVALFSQVIIRGQASQFQSADFLWVALLGISYFAIAILAQIFVKRVASSDALTNQQSEDIRSLEHFNELIINRLRSGIIVVDDQGCIRLANEYVRSVLDIPDIPGASLRDIVPALYEQLNAWRADPTQAIQPIVIKNHSIEWRPSFIPLDSGKNYSTIIFLEDLAAMAQQAQQMKLASLGRFTASIAHELRNPLGAISHAAQLLAEKTDKSVQENRLIEIIESQCSRVNAVIKNILNLTRRQPSVPACIQLSLWLPDFLENYQSLHLQKSEIQLVIEDPNLKVKMDPSQLMQVLTNLLDNALRASMKTINRAHATVKCYSDPKGPSIFLDVLDEGSGVPVESRSQIFEPFFTTDRSGHGLGLYISAELCQANQVRLDYVDDACTGACFRISFYGRDYQ